MAQQLPERRKASGDNDFFPATPFLPGPLPEGADHNQGGSSGKALYSGNFNLWQVGIENNHSISQKQSLPSPSRLVGDLNSTCEGS